MKHLLQVKYLLTVIFFISFLMTGYGQFNENLAKEISEINATFQLNGIEKKDALKRLEEISPDVPVALVIKYLNDEPWKYSHSVSNTGRKYRLSNATYLYSFTEDGLAFFQQEKEGAKTWCTWFYEKTRLLEVDRYETSERAKALRRDYFGLHSITADRLVITKVIKSKEFPDKSEILYNVYFRR
ncbi:MAG: hypothetical protein RIA69_05265 [Cyclobacteriaceae bacterium]